MYRNHHREPKEVYSYKKKSKPYADPSHPFSGQHPASLPGHCFLAGARTGCDRLLGLTMSHSPKRDMVAYVKLCRTICKSRMCAYQETVCTHIHVYTV